MGDLLARIIRSRLASIACLAVLVLAWALPADGFGIPLCQFKTLTGLPCFGCGMTRSFIGMAHLDVSKAVFYHPVGAVLFVLLVPLTLVGWLPGERKEKLARWAEERSRMVNYGVCALLVATVVYGLGRMLWLYLHPDFVSPW